MVVVSVLVLSFAVFVFSLRLPQLFTPALILILLMLFGYAIAELICAGGYGKISQEDDRITLTGGAKQRIVIPHEELTGIVTVRGFRKPIGAVLVCRRRHVRLCGEWERDTQSSMSAIARLAGAEHVVVTGMEGWRIAMGLTSPKSPMPDYHCQGCGYFVGTLGDEGRCPECGKQFQV